MPVGSTILVAVDPSPASKEAFQQALRMAQFLKAELIAISVSPRYEGAMNRWKISNADAHLNEPFTLCLKEMEQIAAQAGQQIQTLNPTGDPVEEIVNAAEETNAGLLILGCPKRSRLQRVLLGQITTKVIGYSPCDVLLIPEGAKIGFERILVGIDGSRYSMEAGQRALDLALAFKGEVFALTVLDIPMERSFLYGVLETARQDSFQPLETLTGQGERLGIKVTTEIVHGAPAGTIISYSEKNNIELIVLGTYGRSAMTQMLLGSVVERVAMIAARPTLVVKRLGQNGVREII